MFVHNYILSWTSIHNSAKSSTIKGSSSVEYNNAQSIRDLLRSREKAIFIMLTYSFILFVIQ